MEQHPQLLTQMLLSSSFLFPRCGGPTEKGNVLTDDLDTNHGSGSHPHRSETFAPQPFFLNS